MRDTRGALMTLGNSEIRSVANVSRDWSAAIVDITLGAGRAAGARAADTRDGFDDARADPAWSQTIVDGPRVLGVQDYGRSGPTLRVQVRTAPLRQDEVARELRRRIQMEFQRHRIEITTADDPYQPSTSTHPGRSTRAEISSYSIRVRAFKQWGRSKKQ